MKKKNVMGENMEAGTNAESDEKAGTNAESDEKAEIKNQMQRKVRNLEKNSLVRNRKTQLFL